MDQNKQKIIIIALSIFISGTIGFYAGRYYEQRTTMKRFQTRMQNFPNRNGRETSGPFRQFPMDDRGPGIRMQVRP